MSSNGHAVNLLGREEPRLRLLSLPSMNPNHQQNRAPLENRNLNASQDHPDSRPTSFTLHKPPRFSLNGITSHPPRMSTPMQPRAPLQYESNAGRRDEQRENGASSPSAMSHSSPDRAYMHSNRRISPPPSSRRVSLLQFSQARAPGNDLVQHTPPSTQRPSAIGTKRSMTTTHLSTALSEFQETMSENERLNTLCNETAQELEHSRSKITALTRELETVNSEVSRLQPALATCRETVVAKDTELASVKASLVETKSELGTLKDEYATAVEERNALRNEKEVLGKTLENVKCKTTTLISNYSALGDTFKELKKAHDQSQRQLADLTKEVQETRKLAKNGLAAMQPMLDDQNTLARAAETKAILKELQEDLSSSHQVIDLLRDKLHFSGSQLMDTQGRVRELEEEKRGAIQQLLAAREEEKRQFELLIAVEAKVAELSERLSARERETFDVLANVATTESELKAAKAEIETFKATQDAHVTELQALRIVKEEHLSKLLALQDIINARDKEGIALRGEVKALNESKAELRALLAESKKELAQRSTELQERNPNGELTAKICDLEAKKEVLTAKVQELEEKNGTLASLLKGAEQKHAELRKTSQNQEAALRAKVEAVEKSNTELSSANAILRTSLEQAQESLAKSLLASGKCQALEQEVVELKGRLNVQSVSLFQSKEEVSALKERVNSLTNQLRLAQPASEEAATLRERVNSLSAQLRSVQSALTKHDADNDALIRSQEKRATTAEASAAFLQSRLADSDQALTQMRDKIAELTSELSGMKEASVIFENENESMVLVQKESDEAVKKLERLVTELEKENKSLREEVGGILKRFETGRLNDAEKELVRRLMDDSQRIHEEEVVRKNNELRRRQHAVDSLKAQVAELQGTIARMIKEKDKELATAIGDFAAANNKPIVGLNAWMSSSPGKDAVAATKEVDMKDGTRQDGASPVAPAIKITIPPSAKQTPPDAVSAGDPSLTRLQSADSDDDDDKPLSELSRLSELDDEQEQQGLAGKTSRPAQGAAKDIATTTATNKRMRSPSPQGEDLDVSLSKRRAGTNSRPKPLTGPGQQGQAQASSVSAAGPSGIKKVPDDASRSANTKTKSKLRKRK